MIVKRVAGAIGAESKAINLGDGIDAELAKTLRELLNEHEVLFRDQSIEPADQKALARYLALCKRIPPITRENLRGHDSREHQRNLSKIEMWHSDMTFRSTRPR